MVPDVQMEQGPLTAGGKDTTVPDLYERYNAVARWVYEYDIDVGHYYEAKLITVTVAGATFVEKVSGFPTVDLYVKIALAINTGNLRERFSMTHGLITWREPKWLNFLGPGVS